MKSEIVGHVSGRRCRTANFTPGTVDFSLASSSFKPFTVTDAPALTLATATRPRIMRVQHFFFHLYYQIVNVSSGHVFSYLQPKRRAARSALRKYDCFRTLTICSSRCDGHVSKAHQQQSITTAIFYLGLGKPRTTLHLS